MDGTTANIFKATPVVLRAIVEAATPEALAEPRDEGWSARDVLAHFTDIERDVLPVRIRRILEEERAFIRSIDAPARIREPHLAGRDSRSLLDEFAELRATHVPWLLGLTDADMRRTGDHDEAGEIAVRDLVHQWAYHDLMHVKQIMSMLQAGLVEHMGNTRKFYDV